MFKEICKYCKKDFEGHKKHIGGDHVWKPIKVCGKCGLRKRGDDSNSYESIADAMGNRCNCDFE